MKTINVSIRDKIAVAEKDALYICGNSDFVIAFDFDDEWAGYEYKTARFVFNDTYADVVFSGNECAAPVISNTYNFIVGVYAGDLHTTTPAYVAAKKSILCDSGMPVEPFETAYAQLIEIFNQTMVKVDAIPEEAYKARDDAQASAEAAAASEKAAEQASKIVGSCVSYLEQDRTDEEKAQARKNIGAAKTWDDVENKPFSKTESGETLTWDGNTDGLVECDTFYRVFDKVKGIAENLELFKRENVTFLESDGSGYVGNWLEQTNDCINFGGRVIITLKDNAFVSYCGMRFPKKGVYFYKRNEGAVAGFVWVSSFTVHGFNFKIEEMDEELLPDSVVKNGDSSLILLSPGGKRFKITVSNNGTLSAAEVTE